MRVVDGLMMCRGVEARTMDEHRSVSFSRFSFLPFQPFTPELPSSWAFRDMNRRGFPQPGSRFRFGYTACPHTGEGDWNQTGAVRCGRCEKGEAGDPPEFASSVRSL